MTVSYILEGKKSKVGFLEAVGRLFINRLLFFECTEPLKVSALVEAIILLSVAGHCGDYYSLRLQGINANDFLPN